MTQEQMKRDCLITDLLREYVSAYKDKVKHSSTCRYIILIPCVLIVAIFAWVLVWLVVKFASEETAIQGGDLAAFVTACISFISLIIGLLTIVTKYFFPEDDEKYITSIVESIQKNDLANKQENAKNKKEVSA